MNPENVVSRFGIYVGRWDGTGLGRNAQNLLKGLTRLLEDRELRTRLGKEGRQWGNRDSQSIKFLVIFQRSL